MRALSVSLLTLAPSVAAAQDTAGRPISLPFWIIGAWLVVAAVSLVNTRKSRGRRV